MTSQHHKSLHLSDINQLVDVIQNIQIKNFVMQQEMLAYTALSKLYKMLLLRL